MAKDLIIGVVDNYDWDKIKYWANSIEQSGFDGYKALIVYNMNKETAEILTQKQFMLIGVSAYDDQKGFVFEGNSNIMVDRFLHIHNFLNMLKEPEMVERVIITDVRDVVFQKNPTEWLNDFFLPSFDILVGSENLTYANEPWGKNNITKAFGEYFYERKKDDAIYCAGVIAGGLMSMEDFCLNVWLVCRGLNPYVEGGGGPDQAAMNILLGMEIYSYSTFFSDPTLGWVVHAGTSMPAIKAGSGGIGQAYLANPTIELPFINTIDYDVDGDRIRANGVELTVVHQWDRVPEWKSVVEAKYG